MGTINIIVPAAGRVRVRAACGVLWWRKRHWVRFSPSTSVSPANNSTNFSIIILTRDWHNRPTCGRSVEWAQLDSSPHYTNINIYIYIIIKYSSKEILPSECCMEAISGQRKQDICKKNKYSRDKFSEICKEMYETG
jgi:hypothetical protein